MPMRSVDVTRGDREGKKSNTDLVAVEEALAIDLIYGPAHNRNLHRLTTTMRTPGDDTVLVLGLLFSLSIIDRASDVLEVVPCARGGLDPEAIDRLTVYLDVSRSYAPLDFAEGHPRYSSCGVCGGTNLPKPLDRGTFRRNLTIPTALLRGLPERMKQEQEVFNKTGGTHGAALFDERGELLALGEDVGRHNALDKLIGCLLMSDRLPLDQCILLMSSRASFEIIQKASRARIPIVAVIGAVSSQAIDLANQSSITLIGFLRPDRLSIYTHEARII